MGPNITLQFAVRELDSMRQEARLPLEKLTKFRTLLNHLDMTRPVTLRELQSLLGAEFLSQAALLYAA